MYQLPAHPKRKWDFEEAVHCHVGPENRRQCDAEIGTFEALR
jgi:hypothetical protein